jgi:hypothetical protein
MAMHVHLLELVPIEVILVLATSSQQPGRCGIIHDDAKETDKVGGCRHCQQVGDVLSGYVQMYVQRNINECTKKGEKRL